jgi:phosphoribosyl 1,2-cyclic phosphodiesterase
MSALNFSIKGPQTVQQGKVQPATTHGNSSAFTVRFWGVRGSVPTPGIETLRYGGNTSCIELRIGNQQLIFDGGTGLRVLGKRLLQEMPVRAHLFFTHSHWDRIQGFPFFEPAFITGNQFDIYGAVGQNGASIKQRLSDQMLRPNFPVPLQRMQADLRFHDILPGTAISIDDIDDILVETIALHGSSDALGYRISSKGYSVVYATDVHVTSTENHPTQVDPGLLYLAHQADLLIYDSAHTEPLYNSKKAAAKQQSATWYAGIEAAIATQAQQVVICHHDPAHEDDFLDQVETEVQAIFPTVRLAREGMVLSIVEQNSDVSSYLA